MSKLSKLSTKALFAIAIATPIYDEHSDKSLKAVEELRRRGTYKIYRKAWKLCHSKRAKKRHVGAAILARSNDSERPAFRKRRLKWLIQMSRTESNPAVLETIIHGLGHFHRAKSNWMLLLYFRHHKNSRVRFAVAMSLNDLDYDYGEIVDALIELSVDYNAGVRDWATYRLRLL